MIKEYYMRYMEFFGYIDDIFAKYRKEEKTTSDSAYGYYQGLVDVPIDYTVYDGGVVKEIKDLLAKLEKEKDIKFTDDEMKMIDSVLSDVSVHQADDDNPTDINFRVKFNFLFLMKSIIDIKFKDKNWY